MTRWHEWLADQPLKTKVTITVLGAAIAALGVSSYLSFRYWEEQALSAAGEQAVLAAESSRTSVESALAFGRTEQARRNLERLTRQSSILRARAYAGDGTIVLSSDPAEEGRREPAVWIPDADEMPATGLVTRSASEEAVTAFLPLRTPDAAVFEVRFSVRHVERAMERGSRLGLGLAVGSVVALAFVFFVMVRREVFRPIDRIQRLLAGSTGTTFSGGEDELGRVERSIAELIEKEAEAERDAAERRRELEEQAGLAEVGELAAEMAHELKRPLANIRTAVELLEQEYHLDPTGQELLDALDGQLDQLSDTMRDLFSLARPVDLDRAELELAAVLDRALAEIADQAGRQGVRIRREYDADTPPVTADRRRLEQVVVNLATNALEAMPDGGLLSVRCRPSVEGNSVLEVEDTGAGIPEEHVDEVTRPFYSTKPLGTGLGLPLVARIVSAHRGRMEIESEPGDGTIVRVTLPPSDTAMVAQGEAGRSAERGVS